MPAPEQKPAAPSVAPAAPAAPVEGQEQLPLKQTPEPQLAETTALFANASELLEEGPREPAKPPPATVEEELQIVDDDQAGKVPPPEAKPGEKPAEPPPEVEPEVKLSKREEFKQRAATEKDTRGKETALKEREAKVQTQLDEVTAMKRQLDEDPIAYLEKRNPKAYEEWTDRVVAGKSTPEGAEIAAMKAEIAELRKETKTKHEETASQVTQAQYAQYLNDAKAVLVKEEYSPVREVTEIFSEFTGMPSDIGKEVERTAVEFYQSTMNPETKQGKWLTPAQASEILLEDAQAHLQERLPKFVEYLAGKKPDLFKQSKAVAALFGAKPPEVQTPTTPQPGTTLIDEQESLSVSSSELDPSKFNSKEEYFQAVAKAELKYEE